MDDQARDCDGNRHFGQEADPGAEEVSPEEGHLHNYQPCHQFYKRRQ